jgi:hypothetical protein
MKVAVQKADKTVVVAIAAVASVGTAQSGATHRHRIAAVKKADKRVVVAIAVVASVGTAHQSGATHPHRDRPYPAEGTPVVAPEMGCYGDRLQEYMRHSSVSWSFGGSRSREQKEEEYTPLRVIERPSPPQQYMNLDGAAEKLEADVAAKAATEKSEVDGLAKALTE